MGTRQSVAAGERQIYRFASVPHTNLLIGLSFAFLAEMAWLPSAAARSPLNDINGEVETIKASNEHGNQKEIIGRVREDIAALLPLKGGEGTETASLLDTIGVFFISIGDTESAIKALEGAFYLRERQYGLEHPLTINTLSHLGAARRRAGQPEQALLNLNQALTAARVVYGPSTVREAEILVNRSSVFLAMGQADQALKDLNAALAEIGDSGNRRLQAAGLANKAVALSQLGQPSESRDAIAQAEKIAIDDLNPPNSTSLIIADVMTSKGLVEAQNGDQNAAQASISKAREIYANALGAASQRATKLAFLDTQKTFVGEQNNEKEAVQAVDYSSHRFSSLNEINASNVKELKPIWTMALGSVDGGDISNGGFESTPLAENGFLYVTDDRSTIYKIDTRGGQGRLVWKTVPEIHNSGVGAFTCCGSVVLWGDKVISHTLDGQLVATNKDTGAVVWQQRVADPDKGEVVIGAPLVVKNLAITGISNTGHGTRSFVAATDLNTQKQVWLTYLLPPAGEPGGDNWKGVAANGGGSIRMSYDPSINTLMTNNLGTDSVISDKYKNGNFSNGSVALDADTGKVKWAFSYKDDPYDYDSFAENVLVDTKVNGEDRKIVAHFGGNGYFYTLDRTNGQFISEQSTQAVNWTDGLDPWTGKPVEYARNRALETYQIGQPSPREHLAVDLCPGNVGIKKRPPAAYNPDLKLWYIPAVESCSRTANKEMEPDKRPGPPEFFAGSLTAVDVATGAVAAKTPAPTLGGLLATPDLVFAGQPTGEVAAFEAKTLAKLWEFDTNGGVSASPTTFTSDGKQYIAILVGPKSTWLSATSSTLYVFGLE